MTTIGERIRYARRLHPDMTQSALGRLIGVSRAAISQFEKDDTRPRPGNVERLAAVFECSPDWIEHGFNAAPAAPPPKPDFSLLAPWFLYQARLEKLAQANAREGQA
jgi:transcriptional regulator with XRE-family HTH domain